MEYSCGCYVYLNDDGGLSNNWDLTNCTKEHRPYFLPYVEQKPARAKAVRRPSGAERASDGQGRLL